MRKWPNKLRNALVSENYDNFFYFLRSMFNEKMDFHIEISYTENIPKLCQRIQSVHSRKSPNDSLKKLTA